MKFSAEALGAVIRESREAKGLTQEDLGRAAGYNAGAGVSVSRIESGLTRPGSERFEGLAAALGLSAADLENAAVDRTNRVGHEAGESHARSRPANERVKDRVRRIQEEIEHRTSLITELAARFNEAHDRARDEFFMPFVEVARGIDGAPQPDPSALDEEDDAHDAAGEAQTRIRLTSYGIAHVLAGGAGGAATGAAVGGAAAYGTFMAAVSFGTASTGAAISGLSGAAATNAALALLGGGTLAAGGAGVAGGTMLLTGIVAAPALLLAVGGLVWMAKRNRRQQQELVARLDEADAEILETQRGFEALANILPRATEVLDYVAVHAGHALARWSPTVSASTTAWGDLDAADQRRYHDFVEIAASQLAVVTINVQELMALRGDEREQLIDFADEVLAQAQNTVETLV